MEVRKVATPPNHKGEFARWFASKRKGIGSQEYVAGLLNVHRTTVARWEGDQTSPEQEHIPAIAKLFAVSDEEVARRAGVILKSEVSDRSLSLARMIETRLAGLSDERWQAATRGLDGFLTALAP